jgi:regulatory protein
VKRKKSMSGEGRGPQRAIDAALIEEWALSYLGRYASTAENLRQVLRRRVRRRLATQGEGGQEDAVATEALIDALVRRYRETGLVDDASYAAGRVRRGVAQGHSLRHIAVGLAAKGVGAADAAAALAALREETPDPDLAAAIAFARRRHLGPFRADRHLPELSEPSRAKRYRSELAAFARAGFDRHTAETILSCPDEAAARALPAIDEAGADGPNDGG